MNPWKETRTCTHTEIRDWCTCSSIHWAKPFHPKDGLQLALHACRAKGKAKGKSAASQISEEGSSDLVAPQSIAAGTTSTASPVKKSRGRPRKTAAAVATARSAATGAGSAAQQISDKAEDTTADSASYADKQCLPQGKSVSEKSPAKKPRGRPRKAAAAAAVVESPDSAPTLDPVLGDGAMFKHRQKQKAFDANAAESSHAGDVPHLPSLAQQSGQPSSSAIPAENRAQAGNAEACLQGNIECTSPGGKLSDLPLRERLDRIQQLLNQAGCTQTDILPNLSTLQKPNSCQQSDMNSKHDSWQQPEAMRSPHDCQVCSASQPIILSPSPQHADSWRQPRAMRSPRINSVASACLQTQMNPCQESGNSPPDSLDNKPMCLLSSSPTPLCRQWLSPVLPHTGPQRSAASPALSELTELISSVRTDMLAKPPSEFTALVSSMPSDLRMSFIEDMSVVDEAELDEAGLKTVEGREAHLYPAEGSLTAQYVSVSCCPSPGVQRVGSPQQGRKRSR